MAIQPIPLDWGQLTAAFKNATADQLADIAESLAPFAYANLYARMREDTRDDRKVRILNSGSDVKLTQTSAQVKYPGESYFDVLDFVGGDVTIESGIQGRRARITMGSGADCLFDHLVSSCWATEVAAGRGTEGQTVTTKSGCTYRIWSTLFGASRALTTAIDAGTDAIIFVCAGHTEATAAATSLSAMAANQNIHVLGFGPYRPHINRGHAGEIFTTTANSGSASVLRFSGIDFGAVTSTGRRPIATGTGGSRIPNLEFENVTFETPSGDEYSHFVDMSGNGSGAFRNLIIRKCVSLEPGLLSIAKLATGGSALGYFQMDDCDMVGLLTIMERTNSTDVDWGNLADSSTEPNGISITRSRLGIGTYGLQRSLNVPLVVNANQIRFTGSVPCFNVGTTATTSPKDATLTGNFFTCTTASVTGAFAQVQGGAGTASSITIMGNSLAGPGSGSAINLARAAESVNDGYTVLNAYRDWTTNVDGTGAPGLSLPSGLKVGPEFEVEGTPSASTGGMILMDNLSNIASYIRWQRTGAMRAEIGIESGSVTPSFEALRAVNDLSFITASGSAGSETFRAPMAIANDGTAIRMYAGNLQLGNGQDFTVYSDTAFAVPKAFIDGATGRAAFGDDDTAVVISAGSVNSVLNSHTNTVGELVQVLGYHSSTNPTTIGARQYFIRSRGTLAAATADLVNDILGETYHAGHDGTDYHQAVLIQGAVDGTVSSGVVPGRLMLHTANASGSLTERVRLNSTGVWVATASRERWPVQPKTIASDELTIATGDTGHWTVDGQGSANDTLRGINGGTQGDILILSAVSGTVDIIVSHNNAGATAGSKIFLSGAADVTLDELFKGMMLIYKTSLDGGAGGWMQIGGGGGSGASDASTLTYTPASNADWGGSDPGDTDDALNVLADRTSKGRHVIYGWQFVGNFFRGTGADPAEVHDTGSENNVERGMPFPNSGTTYAAAEFLLPTNYKDGATFTVRVIWTALTGSGNIAWKVKAVAISNSDTMNVALGAELEIVQTLTATNEINRTDPGTLTADGSPVGDDWVLIEVYRDAADGDDTLSATAYLKAVEIIWDVDTGGFA